MTAHASGMGRLFAVSALILSASDGMSADAPPPVPPPNGVVLTPVSPPIPVNGSNVLTGQPGVFGVIRSGAASGHFRAMQERLADPAKREQFRAEQRRMVEQQHVDVAEVLGIDGATTETLLDVITDQQVGRMDEMSQGQRSIDLQAYADAETARLDAVREVLGEAGLERYQDYGTTLPQRGEVDRLNRQLGSADKLQPEQKERLMALLAEMQKRDLALRRFPMRPLLPTQVATASDFQEQLRRRSAQATLALNEQGLQQQEQLHRELREAAAQFLGPRQLAALTQSNDAKRAHLQQWIDQQRVQLGTEPASDPPFVELVTDPPAQLLVDRDVAFDIQMTVNRAAPMRFTFTGRTGETQSFEAGDGLIVEVTPAPLDNDRIGVNLRYFEQGVRGKRMLSGGTMSYVSLTDNAPGFANGESGTVITGRKGYAVRYSLTGTATGAPPR